MDDPPVGVLRIVGVLVALLDKADGPVQEHPVRTIPVEHLEALPICEHPEPCILPVRQVRLPVVAALPVRLGSRAQRLFRVPRTPVHLAVGGAYVPDRPVAALGTGF